MAAQAKRWTKLRKSWYTQKANNRQKRLDNFPPVHDAGGHVIWTPAAATNVSRHAIPPESIIRAQAGSDGAARQPAH